MKTNQEILDEVAAVSAANERRERGPKRTFTLSIAMGTEAFGDDGWEREMEVARILRTVSDALYGAVIVGQSAALRDRHGRTVGTYEFKEE